jgi:predicted metalloendopeptidase
MGWRIITGNIMYMSKEYRDAQEEHSQRIQGQKSKKEKTAAERCAADVGSAFPLAVGAIYVRDYLPVDLKPKASLMVNDIKLGFGELLSDAGWMDNITYQTAVRKLNAMSNFVAYLDILVENTSAIDNEYNEVCTDPFY